MAFLRSYISVKKQFQFWLHKGYCTQFALGSLCQNGFLMITVTKEGSGWRLQQEHNYSDCEQGT